MRRLRATSGEILPEILREAERALDHSLRALEELDDKSEQLIALAMATVGAELAAFASLSALSSAGAPAIVRFTALVGLTGAFLARDGMPERKRRGL